MSELVKYYYRLTAWVPRKMPETKEQLEHLRKVFVEAFGLEDSHQVFYTVFANIASVKGTSIRIRYGQLVNIAKRLEINKLLQDQKVLEYNEHLATIKINEEPANTDTLPIGTSDNSGELQALQESPSGVV